MICCGKEMQGACWKEDIILRCKSCEKYVYKKSIQLIKKIFKQEENLRKEENDREEVVENKDSGNN